MRACLTRIAAHSDALVEYGFERAVGGRIAGGALVAQVALREHHQLVGQQGKFEIVAPSISILAEPTVALVDKVADKKGTRKVAEEYLKYLYSDEAQDIAGRNFYRPTGAKAQAKYNAQFPKLELVTIDKAFGGWAQADKAHFADGASFDQIYTKK